jgi:hypothetical protein
VSTRCCEGIVSIDQSCRYCEDIVCISLASAARALCGSITLGRHCSHMAGVACSGSHVSRSELECSTATLGGSDLVLGELYLK